MYNKLMNNNNITVHQRSVNEALQTRLIRTGIHPVAARVAAARLPDSCEAEKLIHPELSDLDSPWSLPDIGIAAERIIAALARGELISICSDHDGDGTTACAVLSRGLCLLGHPEDRLVRHQSHRLNEGYGLSDALAKRILSADEIPGLIITADHGSSDAERISMLSEKGIDVIVTDHHLFPVEGPPADALAVVSPARADSNYPDRTIAGCMVAFLLVCAVRGKMEKSQIAGMAEKAAVDLRELLPWVAIGTQSDCVSLSSKNNRAVIRYGLARINAASAPPWAFLSESGLLPVDSQFLAFQLCPRLASPGRLDEAEPGVRFLMAGNVKIANNMYEYLTHNNEMRKLIQKEMMGEALAQAIRQSQRRRPVLTIYLENGHSGVHGLVASRCMERFGCPSIALSPSSSDPETISGSCRAPEWVHMRNALQAVNDAHPGLITRFGGHAAAAGLTLPKANVKRFSHAINTAVKAQLMGREQGPQVLSDGRLPAEHITLDTVRALSEIEPYGKGFEPPLFEGDFTLNKLKMVGKDNAVHASMGLFSEDNRPIKAIWFNAVDAHGDTPDLAAGQPVHLIYSINDNVYQGMHSVQLIVRHAQSA